MPAELVGTWGIVAESFETYLVSPTSQTYIRRGPTTEVTGSVRVGDVTVPLRFATLYPGDTFPSAGFTSYDPSQGPPSGVPTASLSIQQREYGSDLQFRFVDADGDYRYESQFTEERPLRVGTPAVVVGPYTFPGYIDEPDAVVSVTAISPSIALPAGGRTRIEQTRVETESSPDGRPATRYTFEPDGSLRLETDQGLSSTSIQTGTWRVRDGVLRIELRPTDTQSNVRRVSYAFEGDRLLLTTLRERCDEASCLSFLASRGELSAPISLYEATSTAELVETEAPFLQSPGLTSATGDAVVGWPF